MGSDYNDILLPSMVVVTVRRMSAKETGQHASGNGGGVRWTQYAEPPRLMLGWEEYQKKAWELALFKEKRKIEEVKAQEAAYRRCSKVASKEAARRKTAGDDEASRRNLDAREKMQKKMVAGKAQITALEKEVQEAEAQRAEQRVKAALKDLKRLEAAAKKAREKADAVAKEARNETAEKYLHEAVMFHTSRYQREIAHSEKTVPKMEKSVSHKICSVMSLAALRGYVPDSDNDEEGSVPSSRLHRYSSSSQSSEEKERKGVQAIPLDLLLYRNSSRCQSQQAQEERKCLEANIVSLGKAQSFPNKMRRSKNSSFLRTSGTTILKPMDLSSTALFGNTRRSDE